MYGNINDALEVLVFSISGGLVIALKAGFIVWGCWTLINFIKSLSQA